MNFCVSKFLNVLLLCPESFKAALEHYVGRQARVKLGPPPGLVQARAQPRPQLICEVVRKGRLLPLESGDYLDHRDIRRIEIELPVLTSGQTPRGTIYSLPLRESCEILNQHYLGDQAYYPPTGEVRTIEAFIQLNAAIAKGFPFGLPTSGKAIIFVGDAVPVSVAIPALPLEGMVKLTTPAVMQAAQSG